MCISRVDGEITTYTLRMVKPNGGNHLETPSIRRIAHFIATYIRNFELAENVVSAGQMCCRTGFYLLTKTLTNANSTALVTHSLRHITAKFRAVRWNNAETALNIA
ncbi:MAG: S-ribosylhomocysteine lyase [Oscillospiraceae bacterium]